MNLHFSISIGHRLRSKLALRPAFSCYSQSPSSLSHPVEVQDLVENSPWEWWRPSSGFTLLKTRNVLKLSCYWVVTFLEKTISQFVWMILFHQTCFFPMCHGFVSQFCTHSLTKSQIRQATEPPPPRKKKRSSFRPFKKKINIKQKPWHLWISKASTRTLSWFWLGDATFQSNSPSRQGCFESRFFQGRRPTFSQPFGRYNLWVTSRTAGDVVVASLFSCSETITGRDYKGDGEGGLFLQV